MGTIEVLDPIARRVSVSIPVAQRPGISRGATFGVICNSKPNADNLLHAVSRLLQEKHGLVEGYFFEKRYASGYGHPIPEDWSNDLSSGAVAVLAASGD
jgi:hypothetical protein